jgi:hypothetical protein
MALSKDDLRIGNLVYKLEVNNNIMRRKKLSMVDSEGNEWHRYDIELLTYSITPMKICGTVKHVIRGVVCSDSVLEDEYHLSYIPDTDGKCDGSVDGFVEYQLTSEDPDSWTRFFPNIDEAIAVGERICVNRNTHNKIIPHPEPDVNT